MPPRAAHKKSRNGCSRCKQRRVKCDKQEPECGNCHRRNERCEYPTWKQVLPISVATEAANTSSASSSLVQVRPQPRPVDVPITLLFLPKSIGRTSLPYKPAVEEKQLWARALTTNTAEHQYLRYCLISIKCLFLETHEPISRQVNHPWAYQHQITASSMFRNAPSTIEESNWVPVLIFTISMLIFQFASQQASKDAFDYLETLRVLKMSSGVASSVGPFLVRSEMWAFITRRNQLALRPADPNIWNAVQHLENCITLTSCRNSVLMDAVQALKEWIELSHGSPRNWKQYCLFPGMISEEYLMLLADEDDAALLIMIYWCSIMRLGPKRWFFDRWLTRASEMAQAKLTGDWSDVLEWSNKIVSVGVDEEFTDKVNEYRKSEECMMFF